MLDFCALGCNEESDERMRGGSVGQEDGYTNKFEARGGPVKSEVRLGVFRCFCFKQKTAYEI